MDAAIPGTEEPQLRIYSFASLDRTGGAGAPRSRGKTAMTTERMVIVTDRDELDRLPVGYAK